MKFQRDTTFDSQFDKIKDIRWYPYVGKHFGENGTKIMVYAHNIPISPNDYESKLQEWRARDSWATSATIEEYTYCRGWWTKAFRFFVKGSVGLTADYDEHSAPAITDKVDAFIRRISYINFIQGLVKSDKQIAHAEPTQIELSKNVNQEILNILGVTHCICWGKPTYQYVRDITGFKLLSEDKNLGKKGFSSCIIDVGGGKVMKCLRIFHPSMPSFGALTEGTHSILSEFMGITFAERQNKAM